MNNHEEEAQALTNYEQSLRILAGLGVPGAQEQSTAYKEILKLLETDPFTIIEPPLFSGLKSLPHFPELEKLLASAKDAFSNRATKGELADALDEFIHAANAEERQPLPEAGILIATAKRWRGRLLKESEEALLTLEVIVSLSLEQFEEDLGEIGRVALPLFIENRGIATAISIFLYIEVIDKDSAFSEFDIEKAEQTSSSSPKWRLRIAEKMQRNQRFDTILSIAYRGSGRIKLWLQGSSSTNHQRTLSSDPPLKINLAFNAAARFDTEPAKEYSNTYVPDQPLLKSFQWDKLVKGKHPQLLTQIVNDRELANGRVLVIRGCRRSGKTTFLRRLEKELSEDNSLLLPVYVDLRSWFQELRNDTDITDEGLYYEFAAEIHANAATLIRQRQESESIDLAGVLKSSREFLVGQEENVHLTIDNERMTLSPENFHLFAAEIEKAVGRKILLIIDELDWWIHKSVFKGNVESILNVLAAPSLLDKPFSALISHDLTSMGWELKTDRTLLPRHVRFLERSDIEDLAREAPRGVEFSDLAIDFVWRVSGGWPGLAQLIFYAAIEELYHRAQDQTVDTGTVKKAVDEILGTSDYRAFLSYQFGSLTAAEWELLKTLAGFVSIGTGEIKGLRYNSNLGYRFEKAGSVSDADSGESAEFSRLMDALREKEVVEYVGDKSSKLRLRVGILAYQRTLLIEPEWS